MKIIVCSEDQEKTEKMKKEIIIPVYRKVELMCATTEYVAETIKVSIMRINKELESRYDVLYTAMRDLIFYSSFSGTNIVIDLGDFDLEIFMDALNNALHTSSNKAYIPQGTKLSRNAQIGEYTCEYQQDRRY